MSSSSSEDEFGPPLPLPKRPCLDQQTAVPVPVPVPAPGPVRSLPEWLQLAELYEQSFEHCGRVSHVVAASESEFVISGSTDGVVKFWKKQFEGVEFVKAVQAHSPKTIRLMEMLGNLLVSYGEEGDLCFYDIRNFQLFGKVRISDYTISAIAVLPDGQVAVAASESGCISVVSVENEVSFRCTLHAGQQVKFMRYFPVLEALLSVDAVGSIEIRQTHGNGGISRKCKFSRKLETDLFVLRKCKVSVTAAAAVGDAVNKFAIASADGHIRVFSALTGKMEADIVTSWSQSVTSLVLDRSGEYLFACAGSVRMFEIGTGAVVRTMGELEESEILENIAVYEGQAMKKQLTDASVETTEIWLKDTLLVATSKGENPDRVFFFSRRLPQEDAVRDVFNESLNKRRAKRREDGNRTGSLAREAMLHTTKGDIKIELLGKDVPKTVENFCTLVKRGYYNRNCSFHHVVKGLLIQTGDPSGTGLGGESSWGKDFNTEFRKHLTHQKAFTVSMAAREGNTPNSLNSQFFITTVADCHWLDRTHTVFGRVIAGEDVVRSIEQAECEPRTNRPIDAIKILSIALLD